MLRGHPGVDGKFLHVLLQQLLGHEVQIGPRHRQISLGIDAQLPCHRHGGELVISGDHHRADPRLAALLHRLLGLRSGGIHHPHKAQEGQFLFQSTGAHLRRQPLYVPEGHRQHPQGILRHAVIGRQGGPAGMVGQGAPAQKHVGRSLDAHPEASLRQGVDGGHQLPLRVKGQLPLPGQLPFQLLLLQPLLGRGLHQGPFGGLAHRPAVPKGGVAAQGSRRK